MNALRSNKVKIFLTVLLVYLFYMAPGYLSSNVMRHIDLTKVIVDDKTFSIDKYFIDPTDCTNTRDWARYNGHGYINAAPGLSFMAAPIYFAIKPLVKLLPKKIVEDLEFTILHIVFTIFLAIFPGSLLAVLFYLILHGFGLREKESILLTFTLSFGTLLFFNSIRFVAHTMSTLMLFSAFYISFTHRQKPARPFLYFVAGLCLGMSFLLEYTLIIGAFLLLLYIISIFEREKVRHYMLLLIGLSLTAGIFMYYHFVCFGSPFVFATKYSNMIAEIPLAFPKLEVLYGLSFSLYRGIFIFMPIMLVSVYGIILFLKKADRSFSREMVFIILYSVATFFAFAIACSPVWPLGGSFGPRHFTCIIPFLMIPAAFAFKWIKYNVLLWVSVLSIFINWCGVQYGDTDNVFTNIGLFIFMGLNSPLFEWFYKLTNTHIRQLNVITHFSPLTGFMVLIFILYLVWKKEVHQWKALRL